MALRPFWIEGLTPEMEIRAKLELGEDEKVKRDSLKRLKDQISAVPGFHPCTEDAFLLRFLRAKKFDIERAFRTLKRYVAFRARHSGQVTDLRPADVAHFYALNRLLVSPVRGAGGSAVLLVYLGGEVTSMEQMWAAGFLAVDVGTSLEATSVCGGHLVYVFKDITFAMYRKFYHPKMVRMFVESAIDCMPVRMAGIHVVYEPSLFHVPFNYLLKPLLPTKLKQRVHFHGNNLDDLHEYIPPEALPEDLGGNLSREVFEDFRDQVMMRDSIAEKLSTYTYKGKRYPLEKRCSWEKK